MQLNVALVLLLGAASASAAALDRRQQNGGGNAGGAADFGKCTPTMDFQLGRPGRKADQGTFLPTDPLVASTLR